jgi:AraC-like DNA-binding protein
MPEILMDENQQRVGFLAVVPSLLKRLGVDPEEVLAAVGLSPGALDNPRAAIPIGTVGQLLQLSAHRTRCPHFGLEIARTVRSASLGILGELLRNAPTLGTGLQDFATHQDQNHRSVAYLLESDDHAYFGFAVFQPEVAGYSLICDAAALVAFNLACELGGPAVLPAAEILLARAEPANLQPYIERFGVNVSFNANQTAVVFPRQSLNVSVAGADAQRRRVLLTRIKTLSASELDTVTHLRRALRVALLTDRMSVDEVSAEMGMSRRTLHRRLELRGLCFQKVLDETRTEFAQQLLAGTRLSIAEIGRTVGCREPSVFTRMFTRCAGMPPSEWRIQNLAAIDQGSSTRRPAPLMVAGC